MGSLRQWMTGLLVLAVGLAVAVSPASAAAKKKKVVKKEETYEAPPKKHYINGTNLEGRSGTFYGDTSYVAPKNQIEGSLHATFLPVGGGADFGFPIGGHFGIDDNVELSAGVNTQLTSFTTPSQAAVSFGGMQITAAVPSKTTTSTDALINVGGKYRIPADNSHMPDFSAGMNVYIPTYTGGEVVVMPEGTCTYILKNSGLLLNGDLGVGIATVTYVKVDAGVGYPISPRITLIGDVGANQAGYTGSMFAAGARFDLGSQLKAQGLLALPFNGGGPLIGAGIILASY